MFEFLVVLSLFAANRERKFSARCRKLRLFYVGPPLIDSKEGEIHDFHERHFINGSLVFIRIEIREKLSLRVVHETVRD